MNKFLCRHRIWQVHGACRNYSKFAQRIASWLPDDAFVESRPRHESSIPELLKGHNYPAAVQRLVDETSLSDISAELESKVFFHLESDFARQQVVCSLVELGLGDLVEKNHDEFKIVLMLESMQFSIAAWDQILVQFGGHFPQVLGKSNSQWFKARLIALVMSRDPEYAKTLLRRYAKYIEDHEAVRFLLRENYLLAMPFVAGTSTVPVILEMCTKKDFKKTWKYLAPLEVYPQLLHSAIKFKLSYEVLKIYKKGQFTISQTSQALLAAAWSQRRTKNPDENLTVADTVNLTVISGILRELPARHRRAVLYTVTKTTLKPNVMWGLLLACEELGMVLPRQASQRIAEQMVLRPHLEQFRYMGLKTTSASALLHLLRLNVVKANVQPADAPADALVAEADMKLLVGGMIMLGEKQKSLRPFGELVEDLFLAWDDTKASTFLTNLFAYHKPDLSITLTVVGILINQKSYTQAVQLLHMRKVDMPPEVLHQLILGVCRDVPKISSILTSWLVDELSLELPVDVLRQMIINLSNQRVLSDAHSITRINHVLRLLRDKQSNLGPDAAAAIVDGLLARALGRRGGSRQRLQWALDLCRDENVPQEKVKEWVEVVNIMRRNKTGYWSRRRVSTR